MYLPAHFEESRTEVLHALLRAHPLGLLVTQDAAGALAANTVPFVLDVVDVPDWPGSPAVNSADPAGGPGILRGHVARANPVWREARGDVDSLVVFQGPQAYISPSMYPSKAATGKVVPTWNYVMVQARGRLRAVEDAEWLRGFVTRLTDRHEAARPVPWAVTDAPADYIDTMLHAIVGIEIVLTALTGKWKASQNRSAADRHGVAHGLRAQGHADAEVLAGRIERAAG